MRFITYIASLAIVTGTQAAPLFGNLFHHNSTSSNNFPSYSGNRFNLTQVLEEHHVDLSNLKDLNVTQLLGEFGITLPSNIDLDSIVDDLKHKYNSTSGRGNNFTGGNYFNHNHTTPSSTRSSKGEKPSHTGGFLGGFFGHHGDHHDHNKTSSAVSSFSATPSTSDIEPSATTSVSFSVSSASVSESFSTPTASASASFGDFVGGDTEVFPSATTSFSEPSASASTSSAISFISTVTEEDAGLPGPTEGATTPDDSDLLEVTADVDLNI